jgi:hypothetical protein
MLPVEGFDHARRPPARRPSGANGRARGEARFVHKAQPGLQFLRVFFTCGQRLCTQRRMSTSSRSRARRRGRWRLQPSCRSTRHTCETE